MMYLKIYTDAANKVILSYLLYAALGIGIACLFGFICKTIAQNRDIDPKSAFWWGFWLSWLGMIVVLTKPEKKKSAFEDKAYIIDESHIYYCPNCNSTFSSSKQAKQFCPECNNVLSETRVLTSEWRKLGKDKKESLKLNFKNGEMLAIEPIAKTRGVYQDNSLADELKKYKELYDAGFITEGEYEAKRKQILGL